MSASVMRFRCARVGVAASRRSSARTRGKCRGAVEDGALTSAKETLVVMECDGAIVDVHGDGHRVAFNRAFESKGVRGASWSWEEFASLLRAGGGTPYGMLERYFAFYGYPSEVSPVSKRAIENDEYVQAMKKLSELVPLASDDATVEGGASIEDEKRMRDIFIRELIEEKDKQFQMMIDENALKLRSGVERFLDDCIRENDKVEVLIITGTASTESERVHEAALKGIGPLRAAAVSITSASEISSSASSASALIQKTKGDLLAPEVGGDLQRQNFNSDVIIDSGIFSSSRRSLISAEVITTLAASRGFTTDKVVFMGGALSTCAEASSAGCFSVMVRSRLQRGGEFPGVNSVVDGYGAGEGITLRRILAAMGSKSR